MRYQINEFGKDFTVKVVRDIEEFRKLREVWDEIAQKNSSFVPWLCWDWFNLCLKHFEAKSQLFMLLLYRRNNIVAIVPLIVKNERFRGITNLRRIELVGNTYSPMRDFIFNNLDADIKKGGLITILNFFQKEFRDWDVLDLGSLPEESYTCKNLMEIIPKMGLSLSEYFCFFDWYLDGINYSGREYIDSRSKNIRFELRRRKKRLEELGDLEFSIGKENDELDSYINLYHKVRDKSWKHPEIDAEFQREFRQLAANKGWLRFGFLLLNGSPIAAQIRLVCNKIAYFLSTTYDLQYSKFSPGVILLTEMIMYLIDVEKVMEIDNLKGDEVYKKDWTPTRRERRGILIFNDTLKGRIAAFLMNRVAPIIRNNQYLLLIKKRLSEGLKRAQ